LSIEGTGGFVKPSELLDSAGRTIFIGG